MAGFHPRRCSGVWLEEYEGVLGKVLGPGCQPCPVVAALLGLLPALRAGLAQWTVIWYLPPAATLEKGHLPSCSRATRGSRLRQPCWG